MLKRAIPVSTMSVVNPCAACPVREWAICQALPDEDLDVVQKFRSRERTFPAGTDLFLEGESWNELYTVLEGWLYMYKLLEDGRRQITKIVLPGDFVGPVTQTCGIVAQGGISGDQGVVAVASQLKLWNLQ